MVSRREVLQGALAGGVAMMAGGAQQALAQAPRKRLIIDSQVHLWDANTPERPWVPGATAQLPEPFTVQKLLPMMDEAGVERAIIVPPSWVGDRLDEALDAARAHPKRFGVMGRIPLKKPMTAEALAEWKKQPGILGIRLTFLGGAAAMLKDGTVDWLWPAAEKANVPIMFLTAGTLPLFGPIAERHPQLTLIIDHMGLSSQVVKEGKVAEAVAAAAALSKYPNVSVKVSAAPSYSTEPYPFGDMNGHIQRLVEAYGPQRSYWGTDVTNGFAKASYRQRVTHFTEELKFLSEDDKDWIMGRAIQARLGWT